MCILQSSISDQQLFQGCTIFCNMNVLKYVPFKVIYILGLNHCIENKFHSVNSYDLIKKHPTLFDNSKDDKYHHLILQVLLTATKYLFISYNNNATKLFNKYQFPLTIEILIKFISTYYYIKGEEHLTLKKQSKNVISHLHTTHENNAYSIKNFIYNNSYKSFNKTYFYLSKFVNFYEIKIFEPFQSFKSIQTKKINLNHFIFFWKNPIRYFCRHRLKIIETSLELQNNNVENFTLNKINNYNLCKDILNAIVYQKSINYIFQHYEKSGLLPHGEIGIAIFNNCKEKMLDIAKKILYLRKFPKTKTINVQIKNCLINGLLTQICKIGLLEWRPKILNFNDSIDLWFKHLFYCLSGGKKNSLMIGLNSSILKFENLTVESAYYYLHSYIDAYTKGMNDPLLLTKSGLIWLTTVFDKKNNIITNNNIKHLKGIKKFTDTWNGNDYFSGEKENFYIKQVIPVLTKSNITKMCDISKKWLLPILINQTTIKLPLKNLT